VPADPAELRRALNDIALHQAGYFTAAQARVAGYSYQAQRYHAKRGNWTHVDRGLFRIPGWPIRDADAYVRWHLQSGGRTVVSHESALALHDLADVNPARVHLTMASGFPRRDPALLVHPATLAPEDVEEREGYAVTTVERTLLDVASGDLSQEQVDAAVTEALERGLVSAGRLRSRIDAFGDRAALRIERAVGAAGR
jgi:predicted transcriptional regulator of viral defense system